MNARTAALLLTLSAVAATAGCSWLPFGSSQRSDATPVAAPTQASDDTPANTAPSSNPSPANTQRGVWPTTPVPPVTGNEVDTGKRKAECTTAQRLRYDC